MHDRYLGIGMEATHLSNHNFAKAVCNYIDAKPNAPETLQVNIGKLCNQACSHCHVESGPHQVLPNMDKKIVDRLLYLIDKTESIQTVDITGGAPELNPHFRYFVEELSKRGKHIIDRCNLTVLTLHSQKDTAEFLTKRKVEIVASLPCYEEENVDTQRGKNVFSRSIRALHTLNELGYGKEGSGLILNLVHNPTSPSLPSDQGELEKDYKVELKKNFNIEFNKLYTIANVPIKRYADYLKELGKYEEYMSLLVDNFNPEVCDKIMCKNLFSIAWNGQIYNCDFNQAEDIPIKNKTVWNIENFYIKDPIQFASHCYACTVGSGSSCSGALA